MLLEIHVGAAAFERLQKLPVFHMKPDSLQHLQHASADDVKILISQYSIHVRNLPRIAPAPTHPRSV